MSIKLTSASVRIINPGEQYIDIDSEHDIKNYQIRIHGLRDNGLQKNHFFRDSKNNILDFYEENEKNVWVNIPYMKIGISTIFLCDKTHASPYLKIRLLLHNLRKKLISSRIHGFLYRNPVNRASTSWIKLIRGL